MSMSELVRDFRTLNARFRRIRQLDEREPDGDWYDPLNDEAEACIARLKAYQGLAVELALLLKLEPEPDGPFPSGWRHEGIEYFGLSGKPYQLVKHLWAHGHSCSWTELAMPLYGDAEHDVCDGYQVPSACKHLNTFFKSHGIPWRVSCRSSPEFTVTLVKH